jgi:response regulator RpfG family c-di-GMP phosphodiesterase
MLASMTSNVPRVLIADDDVSDLLVLRRLLRDTPYQVDTVRSASQALLALGKSEYAAIVADDERVPDMPGAMLLGECERLQPRALRVLLARSERAPALVDAAKDARYQLIARPFFAKPLVASLVAHAARWLEKERDDTQRTVNPFIEAPPEEANGDTGENYVSPPGRMAQRRALLAMVEMVEAKHGHALGHGARVGALAGVLARELGLGVEALESVEDAALVHDVGELALDPALLSAPRALDEAERKTVRAHVASSYQIARRAGLGDAALAAVQHHHERWDGGGHPGGLRGEAIPIGARILAAADTWDALATDRPHRKANQIDGCVETFRSLGGTQLDPQLVALYLDRALFDLIDWSDPPRPGIQLL